MPNHVHSSRSSSNLSNQAASQRIKDLLKSSRNAHKSEVLGSALQIYRQIIEPRNHQPINALLTLSFRLKEPIPIPSIWNDILSIKSGLNIPLLFRCCVESNSVTESINVLKWMSSPRFEVQRHDLKDHSKALVKLIANNKKNHPVIQQIQSLLDWTIFDDDIYIKTALINAYGECRDLRSARVIFNMIPSDKLDCITIGVWMKALLRNEEYEELLSLYNQHTALHNDVIHMFALQAVIQNDDFETGLRIMDNIGERKDMSHQLRNTMINFYGHFGDIESAKQIFNDFPDHTNGSKPSNPIANINVMLKSYIHNHQYTEALELFDRHQDTANDITFTFALKASLLLNDLDRCNSILRQILNRKNPGSLSIELRSTMIDLCGQINDIPTARILFQSASKEEHTMISIGAMMKALNHNQLHQDVLSLFDRFDHFRNDVLYFYAIKACIGMEDFERGKVIHSQILTKCGSTPSSPWIQQCGIKLINSMIDFYGYFGDITTCTEIFDLIPKEKKDFVSVGSMMNALIINGYNKRVIRLYYEYPLLIDDTSTALAVKACINNEDADNGLKIYYGMPREKEWSISLSNTFMDFFSEFGDWKRAQETFNTIAAHKLDAVSIGTMMKCFVNQNMDLEALSLYDKYKNLRDDVCHTMGIRACRNLEDLEKGIKIHRESQHSHSTTTSPDIPYFNALIDFYCYFGEVTTAKEVFDSIPSAKVNALSINMMMKAFNENDTPLQTLKIYDEWKSIHNDVSHLYGIKACTATSNWERGRMIHEGLKEKTNENGDFIGFENTILKGALIEFYGESGDLETAKELFESVDEDRKDTAILNAMMKSMIKCQSQSQSWNSATTSSNPVVLLYERYESLTDDISHALILKLSKIINDESLGRRVYERLKERKHSLSSISGVDEMPGVQLQNVLIDFFGHFGDIDSAKSIFQGIGLVEDISTVNSMMSALSENGHFEDALKLYDEYEPLHDDISHILALKTCSKSGAYERGRSLHQKWMGLSVKNTMIDFYGHSGDVGAAKTVFDGIPNSKKDIYTVGAMMNVYCSNNREDECIALFQNLSTLKEGLVPNAVCYSSVFKACTQRTAYHLGRQIHEDLKENLDLKWILRESEVQITLMNLYGKSGSLEECERIFEDIKREEPEKYQTEIGVWNAIIYAHGRNGDVGEAKELMECMVSETKLRGDFRTFVAVISACGHAGDVHGARSIWNGIGEKEMKLHRNVVAAIVDCYSRGGLVDEGYRVMKEYYEYNGHKYAAEDVSMMMALLGGCKKYGNRSLAETIHGDMQLHFKDDKAYMASASTVIASMFMTD